VCVCVCHGLSRNLECKCSVEKRFIPSQRRFVNGIFLRTHFHSHKHGPQWGEIISELYFFFDYAFTRFLGQALSQTASKAHNFHCHFCLVSDFSMGFFFAPIFISTSMDHNWVKLSLLKNSYLMHSFLNHS
jgi:hypothetical protein